VFDDAAGDWKDQPEPPSALVQGRRRRFQRSGGFRFVRDDDHRRRSGPLARQPALGDDDPGVLLLAEHGANERTERPVNSDQVAFERRA
jgi:hypothetical protein